MTVWIIEPRDPLIVRDGRPFGPVPGARAVSLDFPFPSTTAGGVRTRDGLGADGCFQPAEIPRVKQIAVRGPLLVELDAGIGDITRWLIPAPADALLLDLEPPDTTKAMLTRLVPLQLPPGAVTDIPDSLTPVGIPRPDPRKPCGKAPRYWDWEFFERWLQNPQDGKVRALADLGHGGPVPEARMHVGIKSETQTANVEQGALFHTRGLEFTCTYMSDKRSLASARRLALAVATDAPNLKEGVAPLGGERRLVLWRQSSKSIPSFPSALKEKIIAQRCCRLILLTPAYFKAGWKPTWLLSSREGVTPSLQAMAVNRPAVVSGWDSEHNRPKPTRRLAPAGTVLFLKLDGDSAAIEKWIDTTWMRCVSDEEQNRHDGFGLAVLGVWDGELQPMEVQMRL